MAAPVVGGAPQHPKPRGAQVDVVQAGDLPVIEKLRIGVEILAAALDQRDAGPGAVQFMRNRHARRPGADNDHVIVRITRQVLLSTIEFQTSLLRYAYWKSFISAGYSGKMVPGQRRTRHGSERCVNRFHRQDARETR